MSVGPWLDPALPVFTPDPIDRNHPLNRGRLAWWLALPPTDGGRQWYDLCGLYHGTLTNGPTWKPTTRPGGWGHLQFDGVNDHVLTPAFTLPLTDPNRLTVAFWINPTNLAGRFTVLDFGANTAGLPGFEVGTSDTGTSTATVEVIIPGVAVAKTANNAVAVGSWWHVAYTRSGSGATHAFYVNGQPVSLVVNNTNTYLSASAAKSIGRRGTNAQFFPGSIDGPSIWDRDLAPAEVSGLYELEYRGYPGALNRWRSRVAVLLGATGGGGPAAPALDGWYWSPPPPPRPPLVCVPY